MNTITTNAATALTHIETRKDRWDEEYVCLADNAPEWVLNMVRDAHHNELPNNWRYEMVRSILEMIVEGDTEYADTHQDIDEKSLLLWLAADLHRRQYMDDVMVQTSGDVSTDFFAAIAEGQRDCISMIAEGIIEHLNGEKP